MVKHVSHRKAELARPAPSCVVREYGAFSSGTMSGATALIRGRYPEVGWAVNDDSDELAFVLGGVGTLEMPGEGMRVNRHDLLFIPKGQKFAWRGQRLELFLSCSPAWTSRQHVILE